MKLLTVGLLATMANASSFLPLAAKETLRTDIKSDDVLLTAINFALTGGDYKQYSFSDRANCIVVEMHASAQQGVQVVQTFHLNNINASRIRFEKYTAASQVDVTHGVNVYLRGEMVVRESAFSPSSDTPILFYE